MSGIRFVCFCAFVALLAPAFAHAGTQFTVTAVEFEGAHHGVLDPPSQLVDDNGTATIAVSAGPGYVLTSVDGGVCGVQDNGDGTWTTFPVTTDCQVTATFVVSPDEIVFQGDFENDLAGDPVLNLAIDRTFLGSEVNWQTNATCINCTDSDYHFRPAATLPVMSATFLVFRFPLADPEEDHGVVVDADMNSIPLHSGDTIGPDQLFAFASSKESTAAWRSASGVDGYVGFRFLDTRTGRVDYGYAHLVTQTLGGFPATIESYSYDRRGNAVTVP
jgi:hypothetical protein